MTTSRERGGRRPPSSLGLTKDEIVARRYNDNFDQFGGQPPKVTYCGKGTKGKQTARGLEQHQHEENVKTAGGDKSKVANAQSPVGPNNKNKDKYEQAAKEHLAAEAEKKKQATEKKKKKKKKK